LCHMFRRERLIGMLYLHDLLHHLSSNQNAFVPTEQGMTLDRAELQLDDAFDFGQAYVALSRVTSLQGLWIRGGLITPAVVKAHPAVKALYARNNRT
jgi:hypothetical protein